MFLTNLPILYIFLLNITEYRCVEYSVIWWISF